jgi:alanyl-tRNA synthetase
MQRQKAEARANWSGSGEAATEAVWFELKEAHGATEFLGYDTERAEGVVQGLVSSGKSVPQVSAGDKVQVVVNQTPFYAESGGQMGDTGLITFEGGRAVITDTLKKGEGLFAHYAEISEGTL